MHHREPRTRQDGRDGAAGAPGARAEPPTGRRGVSGGFLGNAHVPGGTPAKATSEATSALPGHVEGMRCPRPRCSAGLDAPLTSRMWLFKLVLIRFKNMEKSSGLVPPAAFHGCSPWGGWWHRGRADVDRCVPAGCAGDAAPSVTLDRRAASPGDALDMLAPVPCAPDRAALRVVVEHTAPGTSARRDSGHRTELPPAQDERQGPLSGTGWGGPRRWAGTTPSPVGA